MTRQWPSTNSKGESVCDRCGNPMNSYSMSYFNTDWICLHCYQKERAHPAFAEAQAVEEAAVRAGNFNFPGVGKPADL